MKNYVPFLRWWMFMTVVSIGGFFLYKFGIIHEAYQTDFTYLTSVILGLFLLMSVLCGFYTAIYCSGKQLKLERVLDLGYFIGSKLTSLGMLGTIIAFYYIFKVGFAELDITDASSAQMFSSVLAEGVGAAVLTTIAGLGGRTILDVQYHNLEYAARKDLTSNQVELEERMD